MQNILEDAYYLDNAQKKGAHFHNGHQLIFVTCGEAEYCVNNAKQRVRAGDIIIISRFENHAFTVLSEEYQRYVLHIGANVTGEGSHLFSLLFNRPRGFRNTVDVSGDMDAFLHLFQRLVEEFQCPGKLSEDMQKLLLQEMLILVYRQYPELISYDPVVYAVQQKLENSCGSTHTLADLAKEHNISMSSLSHRFRAATGTTVMQYLLFCRLALAKTLLTTTKLGVGEIVEKCGFSDSSNFSRTFRKQVGLSPTAFRQKNKEE